MWIHGGALIAGSRKSPDARLSAELLKRGFVIVSIDYRLAPETKLPGIIEDVQDAWRWVRREGPKRFGIDPDRMATAGGSAGGYLTLMTGFCLKPRPRALVSYYGYGDITTPWYSEPDKFYRRSPLVAKEEAYRCVGNRMLTEPPAPNRRGTFYLYCRQQGTWPNEVAGHDPHSEPKWFDPYCPIRNVTAEYPPTFLIHGTEDTDVPYSESKNMAARLAEAGVAHEFITVAGAGHGLSGAKPDKVAQIARQAAEYIKDHTN
jgi:acetyl esterase/lipase